jgi:hypothetical protein
VKLTVLTAITAVVVLVLIFELVRRRQLREKYALLWLGVGAAVAVLGFFPHLLDSITHLVGVASGVSLVLFLGIVFLLLVCLHLSWEMSRLEEETRSLAEEVALLRTQVTTALRASTGEADPLDPEHTGFGGPESAGFGGPGSAGVTPAHVLPAQQRNSDD